MKEKVQLGPGLVYIVLAGITLSALALRLWGISFDLPHLAHPDEQHEVHRALRLGAGDFEWDRTFAKGGYFYLLFVEYGVFFVVARIFGIVGSVNDFMMMFFRDPTPFWLIGRASTAVIGTFNVLMVYLLGAKAYGRAVGLIAAALLAVSSLNVLHAHYITVDVPMTFCILAAVYFAMRICDTGWIRFYLLAGVFSALAVMTKLAAAPVVATVLLAHAIRTIGEQNRFWGAESLRRLGVYCAVAAVVYVAGNPQVIVNLSDTLRLFNFLMPSGVATDGVAAEASQPNHWLYYSAVALDLLGWPTIVVLALGIGYAVYRHRPYDLLLMSFPVLLLVAISVSGSKLQNPRYILPALPFLFILSSQALVAAGHAWLRFRWRYSFVALGVAVVAVPQVSAIMDQNTAFTKAGNPIRAKNWVERNIPSGARILIEGYPGVAHDRPICPLEDKDENMEAWAARIENESPMGAKFTREKAALRRGKTYDLVTITPESAWIDWPEVREKGIEYVVVAPNHFGQASRLRPAEAVSSRARFYREMKSDPGVALIKKFDPLPDYDDHATKRGWGIEIYQIDYPDSSGP